MRFCVILLFLCAWIPQWSKQQGLLEGLVNTLFYGQYQYAQESKNYDKLRPVYDFIVVGAGTAGCVVANRLSENPEWNVLLIEAGDRENYMMDFPLLANYLQFSSANWKYRTMPSEKYCVGLDNNQCNWPRGKVMGGSSVLNYMIFTRGNRRDFDHWAELGNTGWSYKDVLPFFIKMENFSINTPYDPQYHGSDGYLSVKYPPYRTKLAEAIVEANIQMGIPYVDYNGKTQTGVSYLQSTLKDGLRHSSNKAYILPFRHRKNLHVASMTMVKRILIDPNTKTTQGVEIVQNGRVMTIKASKEVIVSGGSINSPQLLMLSGVGPRKHLMSLNIPVIQNLKVGFNLMDHIALGGLTFTMEAPYTMTLDKAIEYQNLQSYLNYHTGPIAMPGGCEALTFYDLSDPKNPDGYPDMELLYTAGSVVSDPLLRKDFGIQDSIYNKAYKQIENKNSFMIMPMLLRPKSRGRIMLASNNYKVKPMLFPNYYAVEDDMRVMVAGARLAINVTRQKALTDLGVELYHVPLEGCKEHQDGSDEYFACMARHFTFTIYHLSGTCKMGPASDKRAVVDPRLRVHGVKGLRVIDASIMPEVIAGHTNAPTYMIGEKGADMIKEDWGFRQ